MAGRSVGWDRYLSGFHATSAGITEALLGRTRDDAGETPFRWLLAGADASIGPTIDVGCGSAPTALTGVGWVGIDRSREELSQAVRRGRTPVVEGDATCLPFADGSAMTVISSMSLMVIDDPAAGLSEAARVLAAGGAFAILVPARSPMTMGDRWRMGSVMAVVGSAGFPFPSRGALQRTADQVERAGLTVISDETKRFALPLGGPDDGERFVRSLYLPDIALWRVRIALRLARRWRGELGIPLRRIVARP